MRRWMGLILVVFLSACGPAILDTEVTRFHTQPAIASGQSFTILPEGPQVGSLEFQRDAELVAAALERLGYFPLPPDGKPADLVAQLRYGTVGSRSDIVDSGGAGFDVGAWRGGWGPGWGSGWGTSFYQPPLRSEAVYSQSLEVVLWEGPPWRAGQRRMVFQGRAIGESDRPDINQTMPALVRAVFQGFPGVSGHTERIRVPLSTTD